MECKTLVITDVIEKLPRRPGRANAQMRLPGMIGKIVVHYDAEMVPIPKSEGPGYDPLARYIAQAEYHIKKNWNETGGPPVRGFGLMYHYRVSSDGHVWRTQPEELVTWHARAANRTGLAICCDLGPGQEPPLAQLEGLKAVLDWLCYRRPDIPAGRKDVWGHGELHAAGNRTACPGALLPWIRAYRSGA